MCNKKYHTEKCPVCGNHAGHLNKTIRLRTITVNLKNGKTSAPEIIDECLKCGWKWLNK